MNKIKGSSSAVKMKYLLFVFATAVLVALPTRVYQLLALIDVENGFYKDFLVGNVVEIQSSDWVYMDTNFYYVIGVKYGETQYLNAEDGLQNIVDMMDKERSLF